MTSSNRIAWWFSRGLWHLESTRTGADFTLIRPLCGAPAFYINNKSRFRITPPANVCPKCKQLNDDVIRAVEEIDDDEVAEIADTLEGLTSLHSMGTHNHGRGI